MVEYCSWRLGQGDVLLADSDSPHERIDAALRVLEGQALTAFAVDRSTGAVAFKFDLGAELCARPAAAGTYGDKPADQWTLFRPDGRCLVVRDDLQYAIQCVDAADDDVIWTSLLPS